MKKYYFLYTCEINPNESTATVIIKCQNKKNPDDMWILSIICSSHRYHFIIKITIIMNQPKYGYVNNIILTYRNT